MIIINLPPYLFFLLVVQVLVTEIVIEMTLTSWLINKELKKYQDIIFKHAYF